MVIQLLTTPALTGCQEQSEAARLAVRVDGVVRPLFPTRADVFSVPLSQEGRYLGHDFFLVPDPQMPAARVADEAGARDMLGAIAGTVVSSE